MKLLHSALFLLVLGIGGCTTPGGDSYFENGAGLSLHTPTTSTTTKDLQDYYRALCAQANPLQQPKDGLELQCGSLNALVRVGFNDIDLRCDRYLAWIDRKRSEGSRFKSGTIATNVLLAGVVTGSASAVRDIALALGFAVSVYDAYNNAILNGLESSTIKKLVYERRRAYRAEFTKFNYSNYADTTYALRSYLRICTPQTIVLGVNEYAVAGITGSPAPSPERRAKEEMAVLGPIKATAPATINLPRPPLDKCPNCSAVFADPYFKEQTPTNVRLVQTRLCSLTVSDKPNSTALAALSAYDNHFGITKEGRITSRNEFSALEGNGCSSGERTSKGYRSPYEKTKLKSRRIISGVISNLNEYLDLTGGAVAADTKIASPAFRSAVEAARIKLGNKVTDPFLSDQQEYTPGLDKALTEALLGI